MEGDDAEVIATKTEALQQAAMKLGEAMYKEQAEAEAEAEAPEDAETGSEEAPGGDDTVVDADFEEVKDDEKPAD